MRARLRPGVTILSIVALSAAVTACGGDGGGDTTTTAPPDTTTTTTAATTTAPEPTTTTSRPETTTTTTASTTTTTAPSTTTTLDTNSLAEGSGCTPGTPDTLPDGLWFGLVADAGGDEILFDLACWFTGDAAVLASAEDGEESPPPNDYYVRNLNPDLRALPVAADAEATWVAMEGDPTSAVTTGFPDWVTARSGTYPFGVWLTIDGGEVTVLEEQWVP